MDNLITYSLHKDRTFYVVLGQDPKMLSSPPCPIQATRYFCMVAPLSTQQSSQFALSFFVPLGSGHMIGIMWSAEKCPSFPTCSSVEVLSLLIYRTVALVVFRRNFSYCLLKKTGKHKSRRNYAALIICRVRKINNTIPITGSCCSLHYSVSYRDRAEYIIIGK